MMTAPVGGIDPHQDTYTVGVVDANGVELGHESFPAAPLAISRAPSC
jgi:hypothetical protein